MTIRRTALVIYRAWARVLLPAGFRDEYGAEMEHAVAARLASRGMWGTVGTLAVTRVLASFLFDMQPWDPPTLFGVAIILLAVCAAACFVPARRATTIDPVRVLHAD